MKASEQIKEEHKIIGKAVSALLAIADAGDTGTAVPAGMLREELDFVHGFTERCHHRKEEEVLFPALQEQLTTATHNPIPELLREHEQARDIMRAMQSAVDAYEAGDSPQLETIARLAREYSDLLLQHMQKENVVLVNLIENKLMADKKLEVAERFNVIEDELGTDFHDRYVRLAERLHSEGRDLAA